MPPRQNARSTMRFFIIVAAVVIQLSAAAATVGRCCRTGEVLILANSTLECVKDNNELQQLLSASPQQDHGAKGVPHCGKLSHLVQILPEDATEVPSEACLDYYYDESSSLSFPVLVHCSATTSSRIQRFRYFASQALVGKPPPRIVHLRKCCPGNTAYDPESKFCVDAATDFRVLFDRLPSLDFIDVYVHGPPRCPNAASVLVDFTVEQLYDSPPTAAISISIPQSDGSIANVTMSADTSCLDSYGDDLVARVCQELDYCEANVCIRKCCEGADRDSRCAAAAPTFENFSRALRNIESYGLLTGIPCQLAFGLEGTNDTWWVNDTGEVVVSGDYDDIYNYGNACLEFMDDERGFIPMFCFPESEELFTTPPEKFEIGGSLQIISCFFLCVTFLVYCCLPSLQNLHGKTLMCHVASLFVAYATLAATEFSTSSLDYYEPRVADTLCELMSYLLLLGFYSAFFWLNVMCFDIWWTFRGIREAKRHRQTSRFLAYCAYAWGLAVFFVVLLLSLELTEVLGNVIGKERCWFEYRSIVQVAFFLLPVNLTLVVNLIFFVVTARRCSKVKAEISRAMANDKCAKNFRSDRSRLIMNVKLFIVMGIPWLFENVEALLEHYETLPLWMKELFYVVDVVNSLQGLWIFILFVLKTKVYEALRKRLLRPTLSGQKSSNTNSNTLSVNKPGRVRKSASSTTVTSCFLSSSN